MDNAEFAAALTAQTAQLEKILAAGTERSQRQEDILIAVTRMNGFVRDHGEGLAAHQQWIESHDDVHKTREKDYRTLTNRVWALVGIDTGLAAIAILAQFSPFP